MALSDGLVSHWRLVSDFVDRISGNDGTGSNVSFSSGAFGQVSAEFNGTNSFVAIATPAPYRLQEFSIALKLRFVAGGDAGQTLWSLWNESSGFIVRPESALAKTYSGRNNGTWGNAVGSVGLSVATNYHVVVTRNATGAIRVYLNGVLDEGASVDGQTGTDGGVLVYTAATVLRLGVTEFQTVGTKANYFKGSMRDVFFWNRELNGSDVTTLWNGGSPLDYVPPTVSSVIPATGPTAGGTLVTINGSGFLSGATVTIGGAACSSVVRVNSTTITAVSPAGVAGARDVVVTNPDAQSTTLSGAFLFVSPLSSGRFLMRAQKITAPFNWVYWAMSAPDPLATGAPIPLNDLTDIVVAHRRKAGQHVVEE